MPTHVAPAPARTIVIRVPIQVLTLDPIPVRTQAPTLDPTQVLTQGQISAPTQDQGTKVRSTLLHQKGRSLSGLFAMHFLRPGFLCDEYLMATTLAWTGPYRAQLNIKPDFIKPIRECLICTGRPDCDYALGPEFFVYAF